MGSTIRATRSDGIATSRFPRTVPETTPLRERLLALPCLACRYDRAGLRPGTPCPECGAPPIPPDAPAFVAFDAPDSTLAASVGAAIIGGIGLVWTVAWLRGAAVASAGGPLFLLFAIGIVLGVRAQTRARRELGGDVIWVLCEKELLALRGRVVHRIPWSTVARATVSRDVLGRWQRLAVVPRFLSAASTVTCWLRRTEPSQAEAIRRAIDDRVRSNGSA